MRKHATAAIAALFAAGLLIPGVSHAQNASGHNTSGSRAPLNIPFTGPLGMPGLGGPVGGNTRNTAPAGAGALSPQAFSRAGDSDATTAHDFLPSTATMPAGAAIPTLPDPRADHAYADYQRGFYLAAFRGASARAARNPRDVAAMTLLGELYANGLGMARNPEKAAEWYKLAANQRHANAAFALAMLTLTGQGVPQNEAEGERLLKQAADARHPLASYNLALVLLGKRSAEDLTEAVKLLEQAAEYEVPDAQYSLAILKREGRGTSVDREGASRWMARAAANGNLAAQVELAIMLFNGDGVPADETRAARLFAVAAGRGNAIAQNRLARILTVGRGLPKNLVDAAAWHMLAEAQGRNDSWLDNALKDLTPEQRKRAEDLARFRAADIDIAFEP